MTFGPQYLWAIWNKSRDNREPTVSSRAWQQLYLWEEWSWFYKHKKYCPTLLPLVLMPQKRADKCQKRRKEEREEELEMRTKAAGGGLNVKKEGMKTKKGERERWRRALQANLCDEVWGLAVFEATPPLCSANEYYPPPSIGTRATDNAMLLRAERRRESVDLTSLSAAGGRQPWGKNRQLFGNWWYMRLTMQ